MDIVKRKTLDQTVRNSTILVPDAELFFPIGAGEIWVFSFYLFLVSNRKPNGNIRIAVGAPAGADGKITGQGKSTGDSFPGIAMSILNLAATAGIGDFNQLNFMLDEREGGCVINGLVQNGISPGSVVLKFAQMTADPTFATVEQNSFLVAHKL